MNIRIQTRPSSFSRGLGLMLVILILYGTTVEATHRHGRFLPSHSTHSALSDGTEDNNFGGFSTNCSDCLICQLHQNFSTSLISSRPDLSPGRPIRFDLDSIAPSVNSRINSPRSGRGPPDFSS